MSTFAHCGRAAKVWREHGALEVGECVPDDVQAGEVNVLPTQRHLEEGETVIFSWIVLEWREHRERVKADVMKDSRL